MLSSRGEAAATNFDLELNGGNYFTHRVLDVRRMNASCYTLPMLGPYNCRSETN
jgi:hypothetical protein